MGTLILSSRGGSDIAGDAVTISGDAEGLMGGKCLLPFPLYLSMVMTKYRDVKEGRTMNRCPEHYKVSKLYYVTDMDHTPVQILSSVSNNMLRKEGPVCAVPRAGSEQM